jgi:biopolymer transport protein ExbD
MRIKPPDPKADRRYLGAHGERRPLAERDANVIPLIDVVFILILYFMLAGSLDQELMEALLPPQSQSLQPPPVKVPIVTVKENGELGYRGMVLDDAGLARELAAHGGPPERVALHADGAADAARVADVVAVIGRAGVGDLALITRPAAVRP